MGIYIPNMEKPKGCANCPCADDENRFCLAAMQYIPMFGKPNFCPLIEIDQEDEKAVLFLLRMRKAMREGKSWREFLDEERGAVEK